MGLMPRTLTLAVVLLAAAAPLEAGAQNPAPQRIRLGTPAPQGTSYHRILLEMGERWRNDTGGKVQVTVYAGTMGSEVEVVRRMRLGQLQAATLTVIGLREIDPAVSGLQQMPMMYRSLGELDYVRTQLEPRLAQRLLERGFVVLFWADAGWVRYFSRHPALMPDDFRTMKVFVTVGDTKQLDLMKSAGYQPVSLEWTDALTALQTGMVDAVPTPPYFALAGQYYTVARYMLEVNWAPLVGATIIARRVWDSFPPDVQESLRAAATAAGARFQESGRTENDEAVAAMQKRGLTVTPMTPAADAAWRSMAEDFYPEIRGSLVPADMFDEVVRLLTEYRARPR
jgi:TRAP-type C4-dicarboxylate transport system substrate-binding protein